MKIIKKFLTLLIAVTFSLTALFPQNVTAAQIAQNFALLFPQNNLVNQTVTINSNSLSTGLIDSDIVLFLTEYAKTLRETNPAFSDEQIEQIIISYIKTWHETHGNNETKQDKINVEEIVSKTKKFSIKGLFFRIRDSIKTKIQQAQDKANSKERIRKNMESNIKFFPFIQFMLGFELAEAFAMIYIIGSGYTAAFLTALTASLGIISFASSAITGFITSKVSKRTIVVVSLIVHTLGSISLALVPYSVIFVVLSQILPTIGVAGLAVSLCPFFYSSMESLGEDREIIKQKYSANDSFFSIVMAFSSLIGGGLVVLFAHLGTGFESIGQHIVVILAAAIDVFVTTGAIFKTHKETVETTIEDDDEETAAFREMKSNEKGFKGIKSYILKIFAPMKNVAKDQQTFSFVLTNLLVNSVFFAITTLLLQPIMSVLIPSSQMLELYLAIIYFVANGLQSISKKFALKLNPVLQRPITRVLFFAGMATLAAGFLMTSNPLFLIALFISINFFYGVSSVSEIMDIHDILPTKARPQWLALKSILGILVATGVQAISAAMLSAKLTESTVVGIIAIAVTGAATLISIVATGDKIKKLGFKNILIKGFKAIGTVITKPFTFVFAKPVTLSVIPTIEDTQHKERQNIISDDINLNSIKSLLACA
jgi:MFS family permease